MTSEPSGDLPDTRRVGRGGVGMVAAQRIDESCDGLGAVAIPECGDLPGEQCGGETPDVDAFAQVGSVLVEDATAGSRGEDQIMGVGGASEAADRPAIESQDGRDGGDRPSLDE